jgi:hypothetical protein
MPLSRHYRPMRHALTPVRNRSSEIALLLSDVDKIRQERRKAKANKSKYQGQGNDGGMSFITSGGSRYGGFGSETVGSGGGGGGGGSSRYGGSSGYENDREFGVPAALTFPFASTIRESARRGQPADIRLPPVAIGWP